VPAFCVISTVAWLALSELARTDFRVFSYLGFLLRNFPAGYEPLYLPLFVASCLMTGALVSRQLRAFCPVWPTFCLFALAEAVVPPQIVALVRWPDGRGAIRSDVLLGIAIAINALLAIWALWRKPVRREAAGVVPDPGRSLGSGTVFLTLTASLFALVFMSASGKLAGADALAYHLPLPAMWIRTGSLTTGAGIQFHYAEGAALLFRWALAGAPDRFVVLVPFLCGVLTVCVIYSIGRALGYSREVAVVCACCASVCPVFVNLSTSAYSETFGCLCLMLAVRFLLELSQPGARTWPLLACIGLSLGMAAGARYSALPFGFVVAACSLVLTYTRLKGLSLSLAATALFALFAFAGGGYWYLRNLAQFGNPVYPLAILGLSGMDMNAMGSGKFLTVGFQLAAYPWLEHPYTEPFEEGIGAVFGALCIPATLLCPFVLRKMHRRKDPASFGATLVWFLVLASFVAHVLMGNMDPRYTVAPILLSAVLIGFIWREADSRFFAAAAFLPFATMVVLLGGSFYTDLVYRNNLPQLAGAERFELPKVVDEIKAAKILNAGPAYYTYGLMGRDYRHEVVSLFAGATPADAIKYHVDYVFIRDSEIPRFEAALPIALLVEMKTSKGERFSLWRIIPKGA
jgi:hypothetical protein